MSFEYMQISDSLHLYFVL